MPGLNHARRGGLLSFVARDMGFHNVDSLLSHAITSDECAGVCIECHSIIDDIERDQDAGWCECCRTQNIKSVLIIAEIM